MSGVILLRQLKSSHPSRAETPMTSRLAILSSFAPPSSQPRPSVREASVSRGSSASFRGAFPFPDSLGSYLLPSWLRFVLTLCQASNDSRTSATDKHDGLSCLLASKSRGRFSNLGEFKTSSANVFSLWSMFHTSKAYQIPPKSLTVSLGLLHPARRQLHGIRRNTSPRWI